MQHVLLYNVASEMGGKTFQSLGRLLFLAFCLIFVIFLSSLVSYLNFCFFFGALLCLSPLFSGAIGILLSKSSSSSSAESSASGRELTKPSLDTLTDSTVTVVYRSSSMYSSS